MKTKSMMIPALMTGITLLVQSCSGPTYVESAPPPPPPAYVQPAPPPPTYVQSTPAPQPTYAQPAQDQAAPVSYQSFYDELSPYGQWVSTPEYGYVWLPSAGANFQPYGSCGHWVLTSYGWTWVSDYSWGWAAFHYGSWEYDGMMGWYWIPGYQWSPAWVSWRSCNGYYGWAPLGPTYTYNGYATYNCPPERYVFVNATYMTNPGIANYYEPRTQNTVYYGRSNVVTTTYYDRTSNTTYYGGPQSTEVERYTGTPVRQVNLVQTANPERDGNSGNEVRMYRPSVQQPNNNATASVSRPAPQKVYQRTEVAPVQQRQVLTQPNQARVAPYKQENTQQHAPVQQQPVQQQERQQQAPTQQQQPRQQAPAQQQAPTQQQPERQQAPVQQQAPAQPQQRQQGPAQQQPARQQQPAQQQKGKQGGTKPAKNNNKPQPRQQPVQQGQQPQKQ